jgi:hypothetical protein
LFKDKFDAKLLAAWRKGWVAFPSNPSDWQGYSAALEQMDSQVEKDNSLWNIMNKILLPVFSQAATAVGRQQAVDRVLYASMQILKIRARTGKLPNYLPLGLGPNGIDPFDGQPLRYKKKGSGFIVYSVGADKVDDGGKPRDPDHFDAKGFDEVVEFK